ncbi:MAG: hypothetical protein ABIL11_16035 [Chloroflexota bacterium]
MKNEKVGSIIFAKILEMPLGRYLAFIEKTTNSHVPVPPRHLLTGEKTIYANLAVSEAAIIPEILDERLWKRYSLDRKLDRKVMFALQWINTRNEFSEHILQALITYQRDYWLSGKEVDMKPLTLKEFIHRFPHEYLDLSRLSRLIGNLLVRTPHNEVIGLRNLFISTKGLYAYHVKQVVDEDEDALSDPDIQDRLKLKGLHLSVRTICNCRKLLNIPNYKERASHYYGRDVAFSDPMAILERKFNRIPAEPGVYELSLDSRISYNGHRSEVVYIGASKNLRKRIASYSGKSLKNSRLLQLVVDRQLFIRFCVSEEYLALEKSLLKNFKNNYGELPKANSNGETL